MQVDSSTSSLWTGPFPIYKGCVVSFLLLSSFVEISEFTANSADTDHMRHSVASDQILHCLPMSHLWDTRLTGKWVNF